MFFFLFFLLSVFVNGAVVNQKSCSHPSNFKKYYDFNWWLEDNEWRNTKSETDYLVLGFRWLPTYCASLPHSIRDKKFQCSQSHSFDLVLHGLWPQTFEASSVQDHPRNCRNDQQLPLSIIKRFYCILPDEISIQAEWEKHGSCYYKTAKDYFTVTEYLVNQLNIPDISAMKHPTVSAIKKAFLTLNSPELFSSALIVHIDKQDRLDNVRICYDLQYNFTSCTQ